MSNLSDGFAALGVLHVRVQDRPDVPLSHPGIGQEQHKRKAPSARQQDIKQPRGSERMEWYSVFLN